jgi:hypothetical protein
MDQTLEHPSREMDGDDLQGEPVHELPPIQPATRQPCRGCGRSDRPVFGSVCGWCSERE